MILLKKYYILLIFTFLSANFLWTFLGFFVVVYTNPVAAVLTSLIAIDLALP